MDSRIRTLIGAMTIEEKASLCSGQNFWHLKAIERLGVPSVSVADGPHGLRKHAPGQETMGMPDSVPATCFPTACAMANAWDTELMGEIGEALGEECLREGVAVLLGPGVNIKRSPLCGRNFEYFSEDPYLAGEMGAALIRGVQRKGVSTSLKHYAANNQETRRLTIDAVIDERALREIYLTAFEKAVRQGKPRTVMCAYNRLNGTYCGEHKELLTGILREEWGYDGLVVSDWGAVNDRVAGLMSGLDLEMPGNGGVNDVRIVSAVKDGTLDESALDAAAARVLTLIFDGTGSAREGYRYDPEAHHALARRAAAQSSVLLKNENGLLPLSKSTKIAVIGAFAREPRYQGSGSSRVHPTRMDCAWDAFTSRGMDAAYCPGYAIESDVPDAALAAEAARIAGEADTAVVFAGLPDAYESEGFDRTHLDMPESHNALIEAVVKANPRTVVVLQNGAPVAMPWLDRVPAVLECYLGGQAGGAAAVDLLLGDANPCGKLAETFPLALNDTPCGRYFPMGPRTVEYRESVYVGYRYYDTAKKKVLFPFGHGLSYTRFAYLDMALSATSIADTDTLTAAVTIRNTGERPGAEIIELYVRDEVSAIYRPEKELKGFAKVFLEPGEQGTVTFGLDKRSFAYYNTDIGDWHVESGDFTILAGSSSAEIHLTGTVHVASSRPEVSAPDYRQSAPGYYRLPEGDFTMNDAEFAAVYGRDLPHNSASPLPFTPNSTLEDIRVKPLGRLIYRVVLILAKKVYGASLEMVERSLLEQPLRGLVAFSEGVFTFRMMEALVLLLNGKWGQGLSYILKKRA